MPNILTTTRAAVDAWFAGISLPAGTAVLKDNEPRQPSGSDLKAAYSLQFAQGEQGTTGPTGHRTGRQFGLLELFAIGAEGTGMGGVESLADTLRDAALSGAPSGVVFEWASMTSALRDGAEVQISVRIPFYVDEVA